MWPDVFSWTNFQNVLFLVFAALRQVGLMDGARVMYLLLVKHLLRVLAVEQPRMMPVQPWAPLYDELAGWAAASVGISCCKMVMLGRYMITTHLSLYRRISTGVHERYKGYFGDILRQIVTAGREETEIAALQTTLGRGWRGEQVESQNVGHCEAEKMFPLGMNLNQDTV